MSTPPVVAPNPLKRPHSASADQATGTAPARTAVGKCARPKIALPPRLSVAPLNGDFNIVPIGQFVSIDFLLSNDGDDELNIGAIRFSANPNNEFSIAENLATGQVLGRNSPPVRVRIVFHPTLAPQRNAQLQISSNDPADAVTGERDVQISGSGQFPAPLLEFLLPGGVHATDNVQIGLWDHAWNPADGILWNGELENDNFIGRDSRSFTLRVTDYEAASRGAATVTAQWWTCRFDRFNHSLEEEDEPPASRDVTLSRIGNTDQYASRRLMLVTDADDHAQPTHTGLAGGGVVARGTADHRLRRVTVSLQYGLEGIVRASYSNAAIPHANPVGAAADVFSRHPDERKRVNIHFVRVMLNGVCTTGDIELARYAAVICAVYARAGIFANVVTEDINAPALCTGWAGRIDGGVDPSVVVGTQEHSQNPPGLVPHPTQSELIQLANIPARHMAVFFVANLLDPLTEVHAGGEALYLAQTTVPVNPLTAMTGLNQQLRAQNLALGLFVSANDPNHPANRQVIINNVLNAARNAAKVAHAENMALQSVAFWDSVQAKRQHYRCPGWLSAALQPLQTAAEANLYTVAYTGAMINARGCAFLAPPALLNSDFAAAHEITHITTDLNNEADGHFDLDAEPALAPGHITEKNLMHRHSLDLNAAVGVALPKRLWDTPAQNILRANMVIPAQITAIRANAGYIHDY